MSELTFARQFLIALDSRPIKISSDHVTDPRNFPAQNAYTLPKYPSSPAKRKREASTGGPSSNDGASPSTSGGLTVTLKPFKPPATQVTLSSQPAATSMFELKVRYAGDTGVDVGKVRLLYGRKPVSDSKTLAELLGGAEAATEGSKEVELSVMLLAGGPAVATPLERAKSPPIETPAKESEAVVPGFGAKDVLKEQKFWDDLKAFLVQRLKDENEGARLAGVFKSAWEKNV